MKPPPFTYHAPTTIAEATRLLATLPNARVLAGGQSLMPMLNMRLVAPDHVVDLNEIEALAGIELRADRLFIGAMTRQSDIEASALVRTHCPLLAEAMPHIGHRQTRNRGTFGGSLCHLDPSAEQPLVAAALEATIHIESARGRRDLPMAQFATGYLTSALASDELMTGASLPILAKPYGHSFVEFARRHGDFAIAAVAVTLAADPAGKITRAAIAVGGIAATPVRVTAAEHALVGTVGGPERFDQAAEIAGALESIGDVHASADYRRHLVRVLTERALVIAQQRHG